MAYHIYHSDAIVLGYRPRGESDREITVFTRTHGLISVHAKSIREERSKLRYVMLPFRIIQLDYIRGKNGWKVTSAIPGETFYEIRLSRSRRTLLAQQFRLLRRMVHGEEKHHELYEHLLSAMRMIAKVEEHELRACELLLSVRMLKMLGYWGDEATTILDGDIENYPLSSVEAEKRLLVPLINRALRMTHL